MTAVTQSEVSAVGVPTGSVEVCTTAADTLRASVRVDGALNRLVVPMLQSILSTHVRSGRRYLRLDLRQATISDVAVLDSLLAAQSSLAELGGLLVLDVDAAVAGELRRAGLNVGAHG